MCGRPATIHLTEIDNGRKTEKHLCEQCAIKEGIAVPSGVGIGQILEEFIAHSPQGKRLGEMVCDRCGMTFLEFRRGGLLGCQHDYEAFAEALVPLLARAQGGATQHVGKVPADTEADERRLNELLRLRKALQQAVAGEQYERAAEIRDRIQDLEAS